MYYIYMHWGINLPSKKPASSPVLFLPIPLISQKSFKNLPLPSLLGNSPLYTFVFCKAV